MSKTYKAEFKINYKVVLTRDFSKLQDAKFQISEWFMDASAANPFAKAEGVVTVIVAGFDIYSLTRYAGCKWRRQDLTKLMDINVNMSILSEKK